MAYRFVLVILLLMLIPSCKEHKLTFEQGMKKFEERVSSEVFSNDPLTRLDISSSKSPCILFPDAMYASGYCGIFLPFGFSEEEFETESEYLLEKSKFSASVFDSCNLVLFDPSSMKKESCLSNPFFMPPLKDNFNCLRNFDFDTTNTILFLESRQGKFIVDDKDLMDNEFMPREWMHGFSKGAILCPKSKEVIYWLIIW